MTLRTLVLAEKRRRHGGDKCVVGTWLATAPTSVVEEIEEALGDPNCPPKTIFRVMNREYHVRFALTTYRHHFLTHECQCFRNEP